MHKLAGLSLYKNKTATKTLNRIPIDTFFGDTNMKTYKIITLGASGSGKTVFLASMFKALSTQGEHSFYLEVEDREKRKKLNEIYSKIITKDESWPKGTKYSEVSEWTYICRVKTPTRNDYPACQFTYFDYAGGRVTDINEEDTEFKNLVKQADTILGLLDGQKILAWMNGDNRLAINSFDNQELLCILNWMQSCTVPIHFVISKWDLLQDKYSLKQIRDRLFSIPKFEQVVQSRNKAGSPIRLIPVSSVGSGFATLQPDGSMRKISGAAFQPFQVEVPLACVLPDGLKAKLVELAQQKKQLETQQIGKTNIFSNFLGLAGQFFVDTALGFALDALFPFLPPEFQFTKHIFDKVDNGIFSSINKNHKNKLEVLGAEREKSLNLVKDEETALNHAFDSFLYIEQKLDRDFPESDLLLA
ncbi:hypothetical protein F7734_17750 [Scytonema sp. UIC 10036]|uniref:GTPase domain-containing protein n=1 Tax=Scytonema sp. UIC 10036 TaxID=2304196 RepID=UPI0012DAC96F|nr:GTPase domain-containing protein [Scytonema sp. UIC 10036]MUG94132.1 hypothetical protein [Scytonema sp. UIC 10036]